jgi:hypothetical protein
VLFTKAKVGAREETIGTRELKKKKNLDDQTATAASTDLRNE